MTRISVIDAEHNNTPFTFLIEDKTFEIQNANNVKPTTWEVFYKMPADVHRYFWLIRQITPQAEEILELCPLDEVENLLQYWLKHSGTDLGKVIEIYSIVEGHTNALEGDLRAKFQGIGVRTFLYDLTLREQWNLIHSLNFDLSSRLLASQNGWDYAFSLEAKILSDLYDLEHKKAAGKKKIKEYPRPYKVEGQKSSFQKNDKQANINSYEILKKYRQGRK